MISNTNLAFRKYKKGKYQYLPFGPWTKKSFVVDTAIREKLQSLMLYEMVKVVISILPFIAAYLFTSKIYFLLIATVVGVSIIIYYKIQRGKLLSNCETINRERDSINKHLHFLANNTPIPTLKNNIKHTVIPALIGAIAIYKQLDNVVDDYDSVWGLVFSSIFTMIFLAGCLMFVYILYIKTQNQRNNL